MLSSSWCNCKISIEFGSLCVRTISIVEVLCCLLVDVVDTLSVCFDFLHQVLLLILFSFDVEQTVDFRFF